MHSIFIPSYLITYKAGILDFISAVPTQQGNKVQYDMWCASVAGQQ